MTTQKCKWIFVILDIETSDSSVSDRCKNILTPFLINFGLHFHYFGLILFPKTIALSSLVVLNTDVMLIMMRNMMRNTMMIMIMMKAMMMVVMMMMMVCVLDQTWQSLLEVISQNHSWVWLNFCFLVCLFVLIACLFVCLFENEIWKPNYSCHKILRNEHIFCWIMPSRVGLCAFNLFLSFVCFDCLFGCLKIIYSV